MTPQGLLVCMGLSKRAFSTVPGRARRRSKTRLQAVAPPRGLRPVDELQRSPSAACAISDSKLLSLIGIIGPEPSRPGLRGRAPKPRRPGHRAFFLVIGTRIEEAQERPHAPCVGAGAAPPPKTTPPRPAGGSDCGPWGSPYHLGRAGGWHGGATPEGPIARALEGPLPFRARAPH
jgi:hypothetical protein